MTEEEKYFVASFHNSDLEAVTWYKTLRGARNRAKKLKIEYPTEEIIVGKRLE